MQKLIRFALWVCQAMLAAMFLFTGVGKLVQPVWAQRFAHWGYPDDFHLIIGGLEAVAALALLVPRTAAPASLVLLVIMIGAGVTHFVHAEQQRLPQIIVISIILGMVALGRWPEALWRKGAQPHA